jgi:hypothetical protein
MGLGWVVERMPVVETGRMHSLMEAVVGSLQRRTELTKASCLGARGDRVNVGERALNLIEDSHGVSL